MKRLYYEKFSRICEIRNLYLELSMYKVTFKQSAFKDLQRLPATAVKKVTVAIDGLAYDPRPVGVKKLKDSSENLYRIRVGDYRVIYVVDEVVRIVNIRRIGHRKDIYR